MLTNAKQHNSTEISIYDMSSTIPKIKFLHFKRWKQFCVQHFAF